MEKFNKQPKIAIIRLGYAGLPLSDELLSEYVHIEVHDPKVKAAQIFTGLNNLASRSEQENEVLLQPFAHPYKAFRDAHAIAVLTEWDNFFTYDWQRIYAQMPKPAFVFDGRNLLDLIKLKEIGFIF